MAQLKRDKEKPNIQINKCSLSGWLKVKRGECCLDGLLPPIRNYAWIHCFFYAESEQVKLCAVIKLQENPRDISCMSRALLRFIKEERGNGCQIHVNHENHFQPGSMQTHNGGWLKGTLHESELLSSGSAAKRRSSCARILGFYSCTENPAMPTRPWQGKRPDNRESPVVTDQSFHKWPSSGILLTTNHSLSLLQSNL